MQYFKLLNAMERVEYHGKLIYFLYHFVKGCMQYFKLLNAMERVEYHKKLIYFLYHFVKGCMQYFIIPPILHIVFHNTKQRSDENVASKDFSVPEI